LTIAPWPSRGPERICAGQNAAEGWAVLQDPFRLSGIGARP
jgi:hypothetical protein